MKHLAFASLLVLVACDASGPDTMSKDEARAAAGKGDHFDFCEWFDWYGDGECDTFCTNPDPDCDEPAPDCVVTGCSGTVCAPQHVNTTCQAPTPEESCTAQGSCEAQTDGSCGWTATAESDACFEALTPTENQWLTYSPTQCGTNPWQLDPPQTSGSHLQGEVATIVNYFAEQGIDLVNVGLLNPSEPMAVCLACQCPRGDRLVVQARGADVVALEALGFAAFDGLAIGPKQCGQNPWTESTSPTLQTEEQMVNKWLGDEGVGNAWTGFVNRTEPVFTCAACSCPRGDLLVADPFDDADSSTLEDLGFFALD